MKTPAWGDSDLRQRAQIAMRELAQKCTVYQALADRQDGAPTTEGLMAQARADAYKDAIDQFAEALTPRAAKRQPTEAA